ncbi:hypothetical protein KAR91_71455 [Candidatus Pacearchaeota archaeon]|nr:hypothetical protein [Candidatus Pacearchaeota archaeon]
MSRDIDAIIQQKYAESGDVGLGGLDLEELWPVSYSTPGGAFPQRIQFNQLFRYLSALGVEINQKGPFLEYSALIDYEIGVVVTGSDGRRYQAEIANGPASSIVDPVGDVSGTWGNYSNAIGTFTIDVSTSGAQAITGVGFKPTAVIFIGNISGTGASTTGFDNGVSAFVARSVKTTTVDMTWGVETTHSIVTIEDNTGGTKGSRIKITTLGSDGFTLTKSPFGSPTGTLDMFYMALR